MADVRIVSGGQNQGPIVSAEVRDLGRARVLLFAQVNISGDIINPGGGGGVTSVNLSQINGVTPSVGLGAIDSGTLRIVVASDNVIQTTQPVTGAQIVGGSVGAQVTPSGDFPVRIASATAPIGVTGDVSTKPAAGQTWSVNQQNPIGVNIIGGSIGGRFSSSGDTILVSQQGVIGVQVIGGGTFGVTGDVRVKQTGGWAVSITGDSASPINVKANQQGAWSTAISGDVALRQNSTNTPIGTLSTPIGVQVIGGSVGARVSISGDTLAVFQQGAWAASITGDVLLRPNPNTVIGQLGGTIGVNVIGGSIGGRFTPSGDLNVREQAVLGVQIVGGSIGARISASGDLNVIPSTTNFARFPVSGDQAIVDGANVAIRATVKQYTRSNPIAVVLVNVSGDAYNSGGGGGAASNVNVNQINGQTPDMNAGNAGAGTLRVVLASDQPIVTVSATITPSPTPVTGVQVVGGSVGGRVSISGDTLAVFQSGAYATAVTGDVLLRANPNTIIGQLAGTLGVNIVGGSVGGRVSISGDSLGVVQLGAWGTAITGDVLLRSNIGTEIGNVRIPTVLGVQIVGGGTNRVSISGDTLAVSQQGGFAVAVTGDVLLRTNQGTEIGNVRIPTTIGVQVIGGGVNRVSISGDTLAVTQSGLWNQSIGIITAPVGITGDVSTIPKSGQVWPVREQAILGVQLVGASNGMDRIGISGDAPVSQKGGWAVSITGDVLLRPNPATVIGQLGGTVGVNVIGGSIGAQISASGDLGVKPQTGLTKFPVSGDARTIDGADPTIKATVRSYTRANPQSVSLTNASGDDYSPTPKEPICTTIPFRITSAGTTTIAGPYNGRVIKVTAFSLQGESDNVGTTQCRFGSGASGSGLTHDWNFNAREGTIQAVSQIGGGYIFKTLLNQALVLENSGANVRGSVTFQTGDSF